MSCVDGDRDAKWRSAARTISLFLVLSRPAVMASRLHFLSNSWSAVVIVKLSRTMGLTGFAVVLAATLGIAFALIGTGGLPLGVGFADAATLTGATTFVGASAAGFVAPAVLATALATVFAAGAAVGLATDFAATLADFIVRHSKLLNNIIVLLLI